MSITKLKVTGTIPLYFHRPERQAYITVSVVGIIALTLLMKMTLIHTAVSKIVYNTPSDALHIGIRARNEVYMNNLSNRPNKNEKDLKLFVRTDKKNHRYSSTNIQKKATENLELP